MNQNPFAARLAAEADKVRNNARKDGLDKIEHAHIGQARQEGLTVFTAPAPLTTGPSDRQEDLMAVLLGERDLATEARPSYRARILDLSVKENRADMTRAQASAFISYLLEMPMKARKHAADAEIPEGRYAVELDIEGLIFVKVDHGTGRWDGYTFVTRQVGSDFVRVNRRVADEAQAQIRKVGIKESAIRYGLELGHCARCGRELTNDESRAAGIGPICADKDW